MVERTIADLPNLQTGSVINPHINLNDLNKALPEGYKPLSPTEIEGPKGGVYHLIGRDVNDNPIYFNNNRFISFENGVKKEFVSEPKLRIEGNAENKYDWMKQYQTNDIKQGFGTDIKYYEGNDYFKSSVSWLAPEKGSRLNYRVYQQEIDLNLRPFENDGDIYTTNKNLMSIGRAPYVVKNGEIRQVQLHHSKQDGRGSLFEVTDKTHINSSGIGGGNALHPYGSNKHPEYPVERKLFDKDRSQYWIDRLHKLQDK